MNSPPLIMNSLNIPAPPPLIDDFDERLQHFLRHHPRLFVLSGAGCSTASGLGDYRDDLGRWKRPQPITGQTFISSESSRRRYWARSSVGWPSFSQAQPGLAHLALARLERQDHLSLLVTHNVDGLHQKAGHENVIDLHGVLATVSCIDCAHTLDRNDFQRDLMATNPWLSSLSAEHAPDGDADLEPASVNKMNIPVCPQCAGLLKPDVVFFGENVQRSIVQQAMTALRNADALLVVGSSLMVYSCFRFCREAAAHGKPIVIINNGLTRADPLAMLKVPGDCGARLATLTVSAGGDS